MVVFLLNIERKLSLPLSENVLLESVDVPIGFSFLKALQLNEVRGVWNLWNLRACFNIMSVLQLNSITTYLKK